MRPFWIPWNQNMKCKTFSRVPHFHMSSCRYWMVNFTKGNYSSCLPSPLINIPVLLPFFFFLNPGELHNHLSLWQMSPCSWCRNTQPSAYLPTYIYFFNIKNNFWAASRSKCCWVQHLANNTSKMYSQVHVPLLGHAGRWGVRNCARNGCPLDFAVQQILVVQLVFCLESYRG